MPTTMITETAHPSLLTVREVAKILKLSERAIYALLAAGTLQSVRIGGARRVTQGQLESLIERGAA